MHVLFLASDHPGFAHGSPNALVLAALMAGVAAQGHRVSWATVLADKPIDAAGIRAIEDRGFTYAGDVSAEVRTDPRHGLGRSLGMAADALSPEAATDYPVFSDPARSVARLRESGADCAVLFWDTWFEHLLGHFGAWPVFGYLAKPRHDAPAVRLRHGLASAREMQPVRRWISGRLLQGRESRHRRRVAHLAGVAEICALDAARYAAEGIPTRYLPITLQDFFGERAASVKPAGTAFSILGAMGTLHATGSRIGVEFWAREVFPRLDDLLAGRPWTVNIYGKGTLPEAARALVGNPHLAVRGYVDDIDGEVLGNDVFLLCNNAGPYEGAYTRVVYAFSAGRCLVGHAKLSRSMPEVRHGENALLGESGEEIAALVARCAREPGLVAEIGRAARRTYEESFAPASVGAGLMDVIAARAAA